MSFESASAPHPDDTIVAVSSAPGPAARAIVRLSGPRAEAVVGAVFLAEVARPTPPGPPSLKGRGEKEPSRADSAIELPNEFSPLPFREGGPGGVGLRRFTRGSLRLSGVHSPLPATLYFFAGPRSYTGQDVAELHLVGSPPLVERLVADLLAAGARPARAGEFTMRAFLAGKKDLPQAEAVQAVIDAGTDADLSAALSQLAGGVSRPLDALRDDLLNLLADTEAALDFADEDIEFVGKSETLRQLDFAIGQLDAVRNQMDARTVSGRPVRVALVGLPNAGKSSLFNALTGGAALVSEVAGTTRDYLTRPFALAGIDAELIDTAGWQDAAGGGLGEPAGGSPSWTDTIAEQAQRLGAEQATRADVIVWCDESGAFAAADAARLRATGARVLAVQTKSDLVLTSPIEGEVAIASSQLRVGGEEPTRGASHATSAASASSRSAKAPSPPPVGAEDGSHDLPLKGGGQDQGALACSVVSLDGLEALRAALSEAVTALVRPALAPSQSRCRHHVQMCLERLREARDLTRTDAPPELVALALRGAIDALGEMTGAVYTNDLLDRVFSRFCIGK